MNTQYAFSGIKILRRRFPDRGERNAIVKGDEPSSMEYREGQQLKEGLGSLDPDTSVLRDRT
jgi:hypothetical protein